MSALYDKKRLAQMLSKDEFFDWRSALAQIDPLLLNYIEKSMMVLIQFDVVGHVFGLLWRWAVICVVFLA